MIKFPSAIDDDASIPYVNDNINEICNFISLSLGDMGNKNYIKIENVDHAHFHLIGLADLYIRYAVHSTEKLLNKNLIPLAAKYGLTIEEVKNV